MKQLDGVTFDIADSHSQCDKFMAQNATKLSGYMRGDLGKLFRDRSFRMP